LEAGESRLPTADLTTADLSVDAVRASRLRFAERMRRLAGVRSFLGGTGWHGRIQGNVMAGIFCRRSAP
jgi:hypothetical protein